MVTIRKPWIKVWFFLTQFPISVARFMTLVCNGHRNRTVNRRGHRREPECGGRGVVRSWWFWHRRIGVTVKHRTRRNGKVLKIIITVWFTCVFQLVQYLSGSSIMSVCCDRWQVQWDYRASTELPTGGRLQRAFQKGWRAKSTKGRRKVKVARNVSLVQFLCYFHYNYIAPYVNTQLPFLYRAGQGQEAEQDNLAKFTEVKFHNKWPDVRPRSYRVFTVHINH